MQLFEKSSNRCASQGGSDEDDRHPSRRGGRRTETKKQLGLAEGDREGDEVPEDSSEGFAPGGKEKPSTVREFLDRVDTDDADFEVVKNIRTGKWERVTNLQFWDRHMQREQLKVRRPCPLFLFASLCLHC